METYISKSPEETKEIARNFAKEISKDKQIHVIALTGNLGSGKTTFVQGFAEGLGIKEKIISPTFVLIRQHKIPKSKKTLYHVDLYRLEGKSILKEFGLEEIMNDPGNIVLIEWAEKAKTILSKKTLWVVFKIIGDRKREINLISNFPPYFYFIRTYFF